MSPRSRTGLIASRLVGGALLLALLPVGTVRAQAPGEGMPFESIVDSSSYLGQTPLRVWHRTRGYGEETAETALGTHWATPTAGGLAFIDGQMRVGNTDQDFSLNFGGGFRWRNDDYFTNSPRILGVSFWYDGEDTQLDNYFNQLGVSFERLGPLVDLRFNANFPLEDIKQGDDVEFTGDAVFVGAGLAQSTIVDADASLRTVDFEIAPRLFNLNAWLYAGGYQMDGDDVSEFGEKGGVRGYLTNDLVLDVGVNDDDLFGTTTVVQIIWTPGRVTADPSYWSHTIDDRMREQVYRNPYVAVVRTQVAGSVDLTDNEGNPFDIVHVDSTAAAGGDGSFENPLNNLDDIDDNSEIGDIILAHGGSSFTGQSATIQDSQRFLGEGNNETHTILTSQLGEIDLPETAPGALAGPKPVINDAPAPAAIILAGGTMEVEDLANIEISNLSIDGGVRGIFSPTGVSDVDINRMMIANTTGDGIELTPLIETLADSSERVRFRPLIDDVMFTGVGGDDIDLNATTMEPATTAILESIVIQDIESDDGNGVGIRLTEHKRAATITNFNWDGGTTGDGALLIDNTLNTGTVAMNGTSTITGGAVGSAFAISLEGGAANHTVTGTTITNMGGDAIVANGPGTAGLNFTGRIEQTANAASILSITGGHDGNMTFTELTAGAGVINATMGDGLQFNDADGVYTFNDNVNIDGAAGSGATAAVNVQGDSTAVITLTDVTFNDINGTAISFAGGSANMTLTGQVTQMQNDAAVLRVTGGHTGTLAFNELTTNSGVINATRGSISADETVAADGALLFDNADGTYNLNDEVTLNGANVGIDVLADSDGTFSFINADIDYSNASFSAVRVAGSSPQTFTLDGTIDNTDGRAVELTDNTGGSIVIAADITGTAGNDGILIDDNSGGTNSFSGAVSLTTTGLAGGVVISDNTAGSTTFSNLDITTDSGDAFTVTNSTGHAVTVTGTDNTITTDEGVGINMNNATVGAAGINFRSVTVTNGASNGVILSNVTGGPVNVGSGTTNAGDGGTMVTAASAVVINNVDSSVTLNRINFNGTAAGDAISVIDAANLTLSNLNISATAAGDAISIEDSTTVALNTVTIGGTAAGRGVFIDDTTTASLNTVTVNNTTGGAAVEASDATTLTMNGVDVNTVNGGNGVTIANNTNTTLTNVDVDDTDAGFTGIEINHSTAAVSNVTVTQSDLTNIGGRGIDYNRTATATSRLTLTDNTISIPNAGGAGIGLDIAGSADSNITINGTNNVDGGDDEALLVTTSGGAAKTVRINVTNNTFNNNDPAQATASFLLGGTVTFNANITDNTFANADAATGRAFFMETQTATSAARLNLNGNTGFSSTAADAFLLRETLGDFDIVGTEAEVDAANTGGVEFDAPGDFDDIPGPVPFPQ